jgi:DNA polymerase III subunit epsilon
VQLRKRVLSHFSADHKFYKEMRLSQQVHHIEWRETAGEIGALLLEAQAIKALQPIHNQQLRQKRSLCAWQLQSDSAPRLVMARDEDFGRAQNLCGLFSSKRKAENVLRELAETHQLCLAMLGLESRSSTTHPCFAMQLNRCKGACVGKEPTRFASCKTRSCVIKFTH